MGNYKGEISGKLSEFTVGHVIIKVSIRVNSHG